ncbi:MAG: hypothetical protein KDA24_01535 [Deltaproteobacteria bacterium]|nr:hypothetical protein [Deltaproteobacteria bacterium]
MSDPIRLPSFALLCFLIAGCAPPGGNGTDSGNAFQAALTVAGEGALITSAREVADLSSAQLFLTEVEMEPCAGGGEDSETDYEGDFTTDLLLGTDLGTIDLSIDSVCTLEVESEPASGPSIRIEGVSTGGQDFVIESSQQWEFEVESDVALQADTLNQLFLLFDLDVWLDGVDPDQGTPNAEGVIEIDSVYNSDILAVFEANVATTGSVDSESGDDG